jgi:hypothetical protein
MSDPRMHVYEVHMKHPVLLAFAFILPSAVLAQTTPSANPATVAQVPAPDPASVVPPFPLVGTPVPPTPDSSGRYTLHEGEDVNLMFAQDVSSKTAEDGSQVNLTLTEDLKVGDIVVARAGSRAIGTVVKAEKSGKMGKAGQLSVRVDYVEAGGTKIMLREAKPEDTDEPASGPGVMHTLAKPLGVVKHGKDVEISKGQPEHALVAQDVALLPAAATSGDLASRR